MSVTTPTPQINPIPAFDPSNAHSIFFSYQGEQLKSSEVMIWDADNPINTVDNETIYNDIQDGFVPSHTIPSGTLSPGRKYCIKIRVSTESGTSLYSDTVHFFCFARPHFEFENLKNGQKIHQADLTVKLIFEPNHSALHTIPRQEGGRLNNLPSLYEPELSEYKFYLYDQNKTLIHTSELLKDTDDLTYTMRSLKNDNIYYLRATAVTTHGMKLDTLYSKDPAINNHDGYLQITVLYQMIPANILMQLENNYEHGSIVIHSGIISIGYDTKNNNYSISDGEVTFWDNEVSYHSGFHITNDFSIVIKARRLPLGTFFMAKSKTNQTGLYLQIIETGNQYYCKLMAESGCNNYVLYRELPKASISDHNGNAITDHAERKIVMIDLDYHDQETVVFTITRKNNLYNLATEYEEG